MTDLILRFAVALAIGLLTGLERGWRERDQPEGSRAAGIRTFTITGLLGGVCAALAQAAGSGIVLATGFLAFATAFIWFEAREARRQETYSVTAAVAGLCVFALGALAVAGDYRAAAAGGAALAGMLASREVLHQGLKRLTWPELRSALLLAAMTMIVLPILPDRSLDPWGGFNPYEIWFFTVVVASISYLGYIAVRVLGPRRGLVTSGLAGAVASSTAVTLAFARVATHSAEVRPLSGVAALAAMVSVLRVCVVAALLGGPGMLGTLLPPALTAALVFGLSGVLLLRGRAAQEQRGSGIQRNPFDLLPLLLFATAFAAISTLSAALIERYGEASFLSSMALSGAFDVDIAVLSALRLGGQSLPEALVAQAILVALAANAVGRLALAVAAGPRAYWLPLILANAVAMIAGASVHILQAAG